MKLKNKILIGIAVILFVAGFYYVTIPAVNIHSSETWMVSIFLMIILYAFSRGKKNINLDFKEIIEDFMARRTGTYIHNADKKSKKAKGISRFLLVIIALLIAAYVIGSVLSSPIVNAKKYQSLLSVEEGTFTEDVEELSFDKIPLLDRSTATLLGDRKMGSMVDMVSQFEVDEIYSQINYNDNPVRVSPLRYANAIKWFTNFRDGIPAYIRINMATQNTELVKMSQGMKYTNSDHFNRYIYRHLRFAHPTYIYGELSFEIDEDGVPYYIAPVKKFNIGLFGGETVGRVVICNAITGECQDYAVEEVPQWVDRVYSADLLVSLFDYYGTLKHGFFNSILSQKDCLHSTDGYNYLAIDDDVWMYTGVTSVNGDQSNVGFVLANQRTMETKYYKVEGATETSAMSSAEGQVQNLHYVATFPILLNLTDEPTYFLALKDDAGLVKKYAMVNVQKYQIVAIGDTVSQCQDNYLELLYRNGLKKEAEDTREEMEAIGTITKIAEAVIDGNSHYYLMLDNSDLIFDVKVADFINVIRCDVGEKITIGYKSDVDTCMVTKLVLSDGTSVEADPESSSAEEPEETAGETAETTEGVTELEVP